MGWNDVIQLNFDNSNLRAAMIDAMKYWITEYDIDGFRCDYATGPPVGYWTELRNAVNAVKPVTWLSEGDNANYMQAFDYDYAWAFSDRLNSFGSGNDLSTLVGACEELINNNAYANKSKMVYLTNHDLNADHGTEFSRYGNNVYPLTVLMFTIYGMPLIYNGQEIGANQSMGLFEVNRVPWTPVNTTMSNLIKKLTALKRTQPALEDGPNRGSYKKYNTNNSNVYAYSREKGNNEVLVMLNFSGSSVSFHFSGSAPSGTFTNYLEAGEKTFSTQTAVSIPAKGYLVFVNGEASPPPDNITIQWRQAPGLNWTNMYIYNYINDAPAECGSWPGKPITAGANGWYSYTFAGEPGNVIFNNGAGNQIDGPAFEEATGCFEITSTTYYPVACPSYTKIEDVKNAFSLYPNPASSFITIESAEPLKSVSITSACGTTAMKTNAGNTNNVNISRLSPGFYIVELHWADDTNKQIKLIKQ
jgi:hypothetical protein